MVEHTLDAEGKSVGRVASEAATLLMGKDSPAFKRNVAVSVKVTIVNAKKANIHQNKLEGKIYKHFSGYPGGLKEETMSKVIEKKGYKQIFEHAVRGMLPSNRLRKTRMKNLVVTE